jgi:hypothetical protein
VSSISEESRFWQRQKERRHHERSLIAENSHPTPSNSSILLISVVGNLQL